MRKRTCALLDVLSGDKGEERCCVGQSKGAKEKEEKVVSKQVMLQYFTVQFCAGITQRRKNNKWWECYSGLRRKDS